jgi:hypothetical protein
MNDARSQFPVGTLVRQNAARRSHSAKPYRVGKIVRHHAFNKSVVLVHWDGATQAVSRSVAHLEVAANCPRCGSIEIDGICQNYGCEADI